MGLVRDCFYFTRMSRRACQPGSMELCHVLYVKLERNPKCAASYLVVAKTKAPYALPFLSTSHSSALDLAQLPFCMYIVPFTYIHCFAYQGLAKTLLQISLHARVTAASALCLPALQTPIYAMYENEQSLELAI